MCHIGYIAVISFVGSEVTTTSVRSTTAPAATTQSNREITTPQDTVTSSVVDNISPTPTQALSQSQDTTATLQPSSHSTGSDITSSPVLGATQSSMATESQVDMTTSQVSPSASASQSP